MAEAVASLVNEVFRRVKSFFRAPEEIGALQESVKDFAILVDEIKGQHGDAVTAPHRAMLTIGRLDQITARARRRARARNRTNVYRLQDALKENRLSLLAAMGANNLVSTNRSAKHLRIQIGD